MIPYIYFDYVRTREMARLLPVFHHNVLDIVTLACLTGIVPYAFKDPASAPLRHGAEMAGMARWLRDAGDLEQACALFRRAVDAGLPDAVLFSTLWDIAVLERKLARGHFVREQAALAIWNDLATCRNPFRVRALEELAKHQEHREKNFELALDLTRRALALQPSAALRKREERLLRKDARGAKPQPLR
jgi:tetratricopeptide (TPR) repeat protein